MFEAVFTNISNVQRKIMKNKLGLHHISFLSQFTNVFSFQKVILTNGLNVLGNKQQDGC